MSPRLLVVLSTRVVGGVETKTRDLVARLAGLQPILLAGEAAVPLFVEAGLDVVPFTADRVSLSPSALRAVAASIGDTARAHGAAVVLAVHARTSGYVRLANALGSLALPWVGTVETHMTASSRQRPVLTRFVERPFYRAALGGRAVLVAPDGGVADDLSNWGVAPRRVRVIPNGIDLARVRARGLTRVAPPRTRIVTVCRLAPPKDVATLLEAFARVRRRCDAELVVVGDGPDRARLERTATELGLGEAVRFTGHLDDPHGLVASARLFVLSSKAEAFGLTLVEALALGVPIISTDAPTGPRAFLRPSELVPVGDVEALARAIERRLEEPLGDAARADLAARAEPYDAALMAARFDSLLREVAARRSRGR